MTKARRNSRWYSTVNKRFRTANWKGSYSTYRSQKRHFTLTNTLSGREIVFESPQAAVKAGWARTF